MTDKLILQDLINSLSARTERAKKDNDLFVRAFFETIEESLEKERFVKIKGWGTFKLIAIGDRESININTGERFQINGHYKISFVPENSLKENINKPFSHFQTIILSENVRSEDLEKANEEELSETEEENGNEVSSVKGTNALDSSLKTEDFSDISKSENEIADIALPEEQQVNITSNETLVNPEVLDHVKKEKTETPITKETKTDSTQTGSDSPNSYSDEGDLKNTHSENEDIQNTATLYPYNSIKEKEDKGPIEIKITELPAISFARSWHKLLIGICLAIALCLGYLIGYYRLVGPDRKITEKQEKIISSTSTSYKFSSKKNMGSDTVTINTAIKKDSTKNIETGQKEKVEIQIYRVKKGESLYDISRKFYHSDKYVKLLIRYNHITDPDHISYDTILRIPPIE